MPAYVLQTGLYAYARRRYCVYEKGAECRQQMGREGRRGWRDSRQADKQQQQTDNGLKVHGERWTALAAGFSLLLWWLPWRLFVARLVCLFACHSGSPTASPTLPRPSPRCLGQSASLLYPGSRSNFSIKSFCPLSLHSSASFQTVCECVGVCLCECMLSVAFSSTLSLSRLGLSRTAASPTQRMRNIWPWQT